MSNSGDPLVLKTQQWLNATYGSDSRYNVIAENGKTGWTTIYALTRAFQIELGIQNTADNFGPTTVARFNAEYPTGIHQQADDDESEDNVYAIIQGALFCKGYSTGVMNVTKHFYNGTGGAIKNLKEDAGIDYSSSTVTLNVMKALLSMDYFYSYDTSEKTQNIQKIQRYLNGNYEAYIGLTPCDGRYGRGTNKALIYAIQAEEGMSTSVANGNFGPSTKRCCPTIPYNNVESDYNGSKYNSTKIVRFQKLLNMGLYVNGIGDGNFDATFNSSIVKDFQRKYGLPITGICNLTTWLSIFTSCGDTSRTAKACDTATILTAEKAQTLYSNGYKYVGRYLSGTVGGTTSKALTISEMQIAFNAGLRIFPIYQDGATSVSYFTEEQGIADAQSAYQYANALGLPTNTVIYFAVDCDPTDVQIANNIIPYFTKVFTTMVNSYDDKYKIGIYGTRNACKQVSDAGWALFSFVSDMSTGFSGNLGFSIPDNWSFDQFTNTTLGSGNGQIEIDKNGFSGRDEGVGNLGISNIHKVYYNLQEIFTIAQGERNITDANLLTLQYLRHLAPNNEYGIDDVQYDDRWAIMAGTINGTFCRGLDALLRSLDLNFNDPVEDSVSYDILHMAATLNALLYATLDENFSAFDDLLDCYAGWAGDALTFARDIKDHPEWDTQAEINSIICTTTASSFGIQDYIADADAVNIANMLKNTENLTLPEAFLMYFTQIDENTEKIYVETRTNRFMTNMGTYNTFAITCNDLLGSTDIPYPQLRNLILNDGRDYTSELSKATIAFLSFIASELISETE